MRTAILRFSAIIMLTLSIVSCKKSTEQYSTDQLSDYLPLQPGKYITYRLDSTVFTSFGRNTEVHYYEEKNVVDQQITDNLGRSSYRIFRFLRDTLESKPWVAAGSYFITPLQNTIEVVDDNLRSVKLALPFNQGYTWKPNRYLPSEPYSDLYSFSNDDDMADWTETYGSINDTLTLNGNRLNHVLTVDGVNESINVPLTDLSGYASINFAQDKYEKGLGLVYQELIMWEYQPNTGNASGGFKTGFGVKRVLLEHN